MRTKAPIYLTLLFIYLIISVLIPMSVSAAEIRDLNGKIYVGDIVDEDDQSVFLNTADGYVNVERSQIASIDGQSSTDASRPTRVQYIGSPDGGLGLKQPLLARVGSGGIPKQEFQWFLIREGKNRGFDPETLSKEAKDKLLIEAAEDEMIFQEALRLKLHHAPAIRKNIAESYKANVTLSDVNPQKMFDDEIKAYYKKYPDKFMTKAGFLFKVLNLNVYAQEAKKISLEAKKNPEKTSGWKTSGWMEDGSSFYIPFSKADYSLIYSMRKDKVIELKDSLSGWYLIWLVDYKKPEQIPFAEAEARIKHELIKDKQSKNTVEFMQDVRAKDASGSDEDKIFRQALKAGEHRKHQFRRLLINTMIQDHGGDRQNLVSKLKEIYTVEIY